MAKIVIVEDIIRSRTALKELVTIGGHVVTAEFPNSEDAYDYFTSGKAEADLVLLDYNLKSYRNGKEYTGIHLLNDIMKINNKIKVIFVSAFAEPPIIKRAIVNGAKDFIVKPYDSKDLLNRIEKAVNAN